MSDQLELAPGPLSEAALDDAASRLSVVLRRASAGAAVSFGAGESGGSDPERELLGELWSMGEKSVSFSAEPREGAAEKGNAVSRYLEELLARAGASARVETTVEGRLVAATHVGMGGDFASTASPAASPAELEQHLASLDRMLRDRRARTRIVLTTLEAAAKIAFFAGTGNVLVALPAAWKFIRGVMTEWEARQLAA